MKRIIIASVTGLLLVAAGGGWYVMSHRQDPMEMARAALHKGDLRAAGIDLRNVVRDQPANAEAHALLSQVQIARGDPVAAEKEIKRAGDLNWDKSKVQDVLAQAYLAQSKWKEIRSEIPRSGATAAQTAYFLMAHAVAERSSNDVPASRKTIAEAERIDPANPEVQVVAARFAIADGDRDLANQKLDRALELAPARVDALSLKAQLLAGAGDRAGALGFMDRAVQAMPASNVRLERAALYLAQGQDAKSQADVDAVLAKDPKNPGALYFNVVLLARKGKFADADVILQKLDPVLGQFQRGLYFKAMVKANVGQAAQAEDSAVAYVYRYPGDPDGVRLLARIELGARRPERAIPALLNIVNAGQNDTETLDLLGRAYAMDNKRAEAEQAFKRASSAASADNPAALTRLASSRLQVGDLAGAATDLERSLDMAPAQPSANEALFISSLGMGDFDRAQQALDRLRQQVGDNEKVGLLTGMLKVAQLDSEGALKQFAATADKFPDFLPARLNQVKILMQLNRRSEAEPLLRGILDKNPTQLEALNLMVQILTADNRGPEALKMVERAHAAEPNNLAIIAGMAELYARQQELPRALAILDSAKVDGKTPVQLLPVLGRMQLADGQNDAAKATFASLVAADPNNLVAIRSQVELLIRLKDFSGARQAAQEALKRQPGNLALLELLVSVELQEKGPDAALALADRLRADPANMPAAATLKGDLLINQRRFKEAAATLADEFKREPSVPLLIRLSAALRASGDDQGADEQLKRWLSTHPNDADVAQVLASSDVAKRRFPDAERNLQIVLSQRPNDVVALNNLAWVYQERGDRRARQYAQRAFLQAPNPEVGDTFGWILVSQGEAAKALPILQTASAARPNNPVVKYHLAVALKDLNRREEALAVLRPLLESNANFEEKAAAQQLLAELSKAKAE